MDLIKGFFVIFIFNNLQQTFSCCSQNNSKPISDIIVDHNVQKESERKINVNNKEKENDNHSTEKTKFEKKNKKKNAFIRAPTVLNKN